MFNINKTTIKSFKSHQQWCTMINFTYLKVILFNNKRNYSLYLKKSHIKRLHSKYSNRVKTLGLKLLHFKKSNSCFNNKVNVIQISIPKLSPDIISISEANLSKNGTLSINQFSAYNFIYDNFWDSLGWSRQLVMIKKYIYFTHCKDLEIPSQAIIWIEIPLANTKNLLLVGGYRQWQLPKNAILLTLDLLPTK